MTSTLSLLPDPYILARENSFTWSAEFVDRTEEEAGLRFDLAPGPLRLRSLPMRNKRPKSVVMKMNLNRLNLKEPSLEMMRTRP